MADQNDHTPEDKAKALQHIVDAWERALAEGVSPEALASTAIFAALTDMIDIHGAEAVAQFCDGLGDRVRAGEFTLSNEF
ncbi:MAG: hypothetical protein AAGB25_02565 [Pseudomonadota bacterium]